jgi:hypothetical protein
MNMITIKESLVESLEQRHARIIRRIRFVHTNPMDTIPYQYILNIEETNQLSKDEFIEMKNNIFQLH